MFLARANGDQRPCPPSEVQSTWRHAKCCRTSTAMAVGFSPHLPRLNGGDVQQQRVMRLGQKVCQPDSAHCNNRTECSRTTVDPCASRPRHFAADGLAVACRGDGSLRTIGMYSEHSRTTCSTNPTISTTDTFYPYRATTDTVSQALPGYWHLLELGCGKHSIDPAAAQRRFWVAEVERISSRRLLKIEREEHYSHGTRPWC
ncbi:hypothetical protein BU23DRAFT_255558 [Bimuria novae-zelandiae CBS 107.79]|uniref:Uncharacterized protein n=1 Tax=Bimuria novae-zelandiae CBS 107.79 TaxID=1447943 RepID=A0A6A5UYA4_9PLEO|nr:hypothetical protein BU23DRAFT_255558 [Bimuria novae-zelandiae CBS 107.79]